MATSLYESFALYGSGVTLVTVRDDGADRFFVAGSVLTASVDPFTLAVSVGRYRDALPAIAGGAIWTVNVLADRHLPLVRRLTTRTTREQRLDALRAAGAVCSDEGPLWLPDTLVTFWCTTRSVTTVHDQALLVGEVDRGSEHQDGLPLLRWNHNYVTATAPARSGPVTGQGRV